MQSNRNNIINTHYFINNDIYNLYNDNNDNNIINNRNNTHYFINNTFNNTINNFINEQNYYVKIAYTEIFRNIYINDINWNNIEIIKNKIIDKIPILKYKEFELVECGKGEEAEKIPNNTIPICKSIYVRVLGETDCPICYEPYCKQKPRMLNKFCGHECCKTCFNRVLNTIGSTCHICRGRMF